MSTPDKKDEKDRPPLGDLTMPLGRTGKPYKRSPAVFKLQAAAMLRDAASGMQVKDIAKKYGVVRETVYRRLSYAERANLFTRFEDAILDKMAPKAESALMKALDREADDDFRGKPEVALEIYKGTRLLKRDAGKSPSQLIPGGEDSLEAHIARLRAKAAEDLETTDAEYSIEERRVLGLLPEGNDSHSEGSEGDSVAAGGPLGHSGEPLDGIEGGGEPD